jgi:hypothetical protein
VLDVAEWHMIDPNLWDHRHLRFVPPRAEVCWPLLHGKGKKRATRPFGKSDEKLTECCIRFAGVHHEHARPAGLTGMWDSGLIGSSLVA